MTQTLDTRRYWERRLQSNLSLRGTGHRAFGIAYNQVMYQAQTDTLDGLLMRHQITIQNKHILDVGSGTGFFIDYFSNQGARSIVGSDLAATSVEYLHDTFPQFQFVQCDVAEAHLPFTQEFDLISCISVLYHVVEDWRFERALHNLCTGITSGGYLLLSDTFRRSQIPTGWHARFRTRKEYEKVLNAHKVELVEIVPMYYFLNRTFIPIIGPKLINALGFAKWMYHMDAFLRDRRVPYGAGMKLMLAQRTL